MIAARENESESLREASLADDVERVIFALENGSESLPKRDQRLMQIK